MLFLNLLNRIFGKGHPLTREDIDTYRSDANLRQEIEEQAMNEPFDNEALEGFERAQMDTSAMRELDKRMEEQFNPNFNATNGWVLGVLVTAASITLLIWLIPNNWFSDDTALAHVEKSETKTEDKTQQAQPLTNELNTHKEIITTTETDEKTISSESLSSTDKKVDAILEEEMDEDKELPEESEELFIVSKLTVNHTNTLHTNNNYRLKQHVGAEIYIEGYKTVDYSAIRPEKWLDHTENIRGVPANLEDKNKTIDDPYTTTTKTYTDVLTDGLTHLKANNYHDAIANFDLLLATYKDDVNANFYKGLALFYLDKHNEAIPYFSEAYSIALGNFYEEALWFKAQSFLKVDSKKGKELLKRVVRENGFYAEQASEKLKTFSRP